MQYKKTSPLLSYYIIIRHQSRSAIKNNEKENMDGKFLFLKNLTCDYPLRTLFSHFRILQSCLFSFLFSPLL